MSPARPAPARSPRRAAGAVAAFAVALYASTLLNGFVFDDHAQIVDNPWIRDVRHLGLLFTSDVWGFAGTPSSYYRPLMSVGHLLVRALAGPSPLGFHALNLLMHVIVTLLVLALLRRLVGHDHGGAVLLGALVFAAHPIHVEAVAWASALPDLGCAAFVLLALVAFTASWHRTAAAPSLHAVGAGCFLAAMLFKEPGAALPVIIALLDAARRPRGLGPAYWSSRYGWLAVAGAAYLVLRTQALGALVVHEAAVRTTTIPALELAGTALWRYVAMLVVPYPLNAFQTLDSAVGLPWWLSLVAATACTVAAVARASVRWTAAAALAFLPLVPALHAPALLPGLDNPWAERYVYLPSVGLSLAVAAATASLAPRWRRALLPVPVAVIALFSGMTITRTAVWHDDLTLWSDTVRKSPAAGAAHASLGHALFVRGDVDRAIAEYRIAIALKPDYADAHLNLAVALATQGRHRDALPLYARTLELQPRNALAHADLAISLSLLGWQPEAYAEARRAVELRPALAKAHLALGMALGNGGDVAGAARAFRRAAELDPADELSRANLARAEGMLAAGRR